jgi:hypothetical protein
MVAIEWLRQGHADSKAKVEIIAQLITYIVRGHGLIEHEAISVSM